MTATLIVEDGTKPAGANTYVNVSTFNQYLTDRGFSAMDDTTSTNYIILAMDYLESLQYIGTKSILTQNLQWPRYNVVIDTWWVPYNTIPVQLIRSQCEIAYQISKQNDPLQDRPRRSHRERVNGIEIEYSPGASSIIMPVKIMAQLWKLVKGGNVGSGFGVGRS